MEGISVGDIVFVNFPFSDLSSAKLRPAVVVASVKNNDWILCQITSKAYADTSSIEINKSHFESGALNIISYIRPGKIFTSHYSIINKRVGTLKADIRCLLVNEIIKIISV